MLLHFTCNYHFHSRQKRRQLYYWWERLADLQCHCCWHNSKFIDSSYVPVEQKEDWHEGKEWKCSKWSRDRYLKKIWEANAYPYSLLHLCYMCWLDGSPLWLNQFWEGSYLMRWLKLSSSLRLAGGLVYVLLLNFMFLIRHGHVVHLLSDSVQNWHGETKLNKERVEDPHGERGWELYD